MTKRSRKGKSTAAVSKALPGVRKAKAVIKAPPLPDSIRALGGRPRSHKPRIETIDGQRYEVWGEVITTQDAAEFLGRAHTTITRWRRHGHITPLVKGDPEKRQPTLFDSVFVLDYSVKREIERLVGTAPSGDAEFLSRDQEQARLYREQRIKLERENAEKRARMLDAEGVAAMREHVANHIRERLLAIPDEVAGAVTEATHPAACHDILRDAIYAALTELSETEIVVADDRRADR